MDDQTLNYLEDGPTEAQVLAAVIAGTATTRYVGVTLPVMSRVPVTVLSDVDAMAKLSGKSRSAMVVNLLGVAVQEVYRAFDEPTRQRYYKAHMEALTALQSAPDAKSEEV